MISLKYLKGKSNQTKKSCQTRLICQEKNTQIEEENGPILWKMQTTKTNARRSW